MRVAAVIAGAKMGLRQNIIKQQLALNGSTVIKTTVSILAAAGVEPLVVVSGRNAEDLIRHLGRKTVVHVTNHQYEHTDMLYSYLLGLEQVGDAELIFLLPADVPLMERSSLLAMLHYMEMHPQCDVLQPRLNARRGHPVLIRGQVAAQLPAYSGSGGLRDALCSMHIQRETITLYDEGLYLDVDKPGDYQRFCQYMEHQTLQAPLNCYVDVVLGREKGFFNSELAELLRQISLTRSLAVACKELDISYSKGWKAIKSAELQLGFELLVSARGGSSGGESALTDQGAALLERYQKLQQRITSLCGDEIESLFGWEQAGFQG